MKVASDMFGVTGFKLNSALTRYLQEYPTSQLQATTKGITTYHARAWRVRDRLSEQDIADLITAFNAGTPKHELAKRYGIGMKSVKLLLREAGVKKPSGWNPRL